MLDLVPLARPRREVAHLNAQSGVVCEVLQFELPCTRAVPIRASFGLRSKYRKLRHDGLFAQGPLSLSCAVPDCRCKITYAPVTKPNGMTYRYYRCADGRRVHRDAGQSQVNVKEDDVLDQLGGVIDAIALTPDVVDAIVKGLNETHRTATRAKERAAEGYRAEIKELEAKEDRLFDLFDKQDIDRTTYDRQLTRLRADKAETFEKLRQTDKAEDAKYLVTAERVLELAKNANSLWKGRTPTERRDFLERLVCNPRLDGRSVQYDLRKPFDVIAKMGGDEGWRPQGDSNTHQTLDLSMFSAPLPVLSPKRVPPIPPDFPRLPKVTGNVWQRLSCAGSGDNCPLGP